MVNLTGNFTESQTISNIIRIIHEEHKIDDVFDEEDTLYRTEKSEYDDITRFDSTWYSFYAFLVEILKSVTNIGAVTSCIIIIYAIYRFKKLRTRLNMYILQYAIYFSLYTFVNPALKSFYRIVYNRFYHETLRCFMYDLEQTALLLSLMFISALGFKWYLTSFKPVALKRFNFLCKHPMLIIYFIGSLKLILKYLSCYNYKYSWVGYTNFLEMYYPIELICIIVLNIIKYKCRIPHYNEKISYALLINTVVVLSLIPDLLYDIIYDWSPFKILDHIMVYISFIPTLLFEGHPILVLWIFSRTNKNFQYVLDFILRPSMMGYGPEMLDNNSENFIAQNNDVSNGTSTYINTQMVDHEIETEEQVIVNI